MGAQSPWQHRCRLIFVNLQCEPCFMSISSAKSFEAAHGFWKVCALLHETEFPLGECLLLCISVLRLNYENSGTNY
jgi:hypothetical protein